MNKKAHTIYLFENISEKFLKIPKNYRSKFINDLLEEFFKNNKEVTFTVSVNSSIEKNLKIEEKKLDNEDQF